MPLDPERGIEDEVTRVESVGYLQGASGHAVFTMVILAVGGIGYQITGRSAFLVGGIAAAFLVSANGLSIYLWDLVTTYVRIQSGDDQPTASVERTTERQPLSVSSPSLAHKSEFLASVFQVLVLLVTLGVVVNMYKRLEPDAATLLLGSVLIVGNGAALLLKSLGIT